MFKEFAPGKDPANGESLTEVAFFLGAGASIEAGVPDTFSFVKAFIESLDPSNKSIVEHLIQILNSWGAEQSPTKTVDIELLLEAIQRLANKEQDLLLPFFEGITLKSPSFDAASLLGKLRGFIKSRVIVDPKAVKYLKPLRAFIQEFRPLDIYSSNYDTCIELFCSENKLDYKDGFDEAWNPKVFDDTDIDLRLFKIHGSATWYRSDRGRYLKIPVMTGDSSVQLITKESAEGLMLYPAQKFEYVEPLFELLIEMKRRLARCRTLFVVGYSFRDDHIRRIFWDIARKNKDFYIVLISPDARKIYEEKLKTYEGGIPSSLEDKVICLPYLFEKILPVLRSEFFSNIRFSRASLNKRKDAEIAGQTIDWSEGLIQAARGGDSEVLRAILDKCSQLEPKDLQRYPDLNEKIFEAGILGIMHSIGNSDSEMISYFWRKVSDSICSIINEVAVEVQPSHSIIYVRSRSGSYLFSAYGFLQVTQDQFVTRMPWMKESEPLSRLTKFLENLYEWLKPWSTAGISFSVYRSVRHSCPSGLLQSLEAVSGKPNCIIGGDDIGPLISQQIREVEKNKIGEIIQRYEKLLIP